jgi:predicted TIM-barrel fold metal-dependent hydrolase
MSYRELLGAVRRYPDRLFLAAGGGELSPMITGTGPEAVTPEIRARFERTAEAIVRDGARAFGEMTALHYSFHANHPFIQVDADHPLFLLLADIAARNDLPIDLHMEAVPLDQATPAALIQRSSANPPVTRASIPGLERLLAHNRRARVVWVHVGWDNTGHMTADLVGRLLAAHPNLYCSLKFVRRDLEAFRTGVDLVDEGGAGFRPEWTRLFARFGDRFMVGSDEFVGTGPGGRRIGPPSFADTWALIRELPPPLRPKIAHENARRVYRLR